MKRMGTRILSAFMAVVMTVTMLPIFGERAEAAVSMVIMKPTASTTSQSNPARVTTKMLDIEVQYFDISDSNLSKMYYELHNLTTDYKVTIKENPARKIGTNQAVFEGIELREGLNKITVFLDAPSNPSSLPLWVNFTEVATISNLKIDDRNFANGILVPESNQRTAGMNLIFIEGTAPNAQEVRGYSTLTPGGVPSSFLMPGTGEFSFSAGEDNLAELRLRPGDNWLKLIASNPTKTYQADRHFIYNNGQAFFFNTRVTHGTNLANIDTHLYLEPNFVAVNNLGGYTFNMRTDIKINRELDGSLSHDQFSLSVNGGPAIQGIISSIGGSSADITIGGTTSSVAFHATDEYYLFRNVSIPNIPIDASSSTQSLEITFESGINSSQGQTFNFYFVNDFEPYVEEVRLSNGTPFYSGIEISIMTSTFDLQIDTKNGTEQVNVYLPDDSTTVPVARAVYGDASGTFTLSLNKDIIPEGKSRIRFVPVKDGTEFPIGQKEYVINYNPSPYVYITNVYNGESFKDALVEPKLLHPDGTRTNGPFLQMIPVNIPSNQYGDIRIRFNDQYDRVRTNNTGFTSTTRENLFSGHKLSGDVLETSGGAFVELRFQFGKNVHPNRNWEFVEGLNNLIIEVYAPGALDDNGRPRPGREPITTHRYELFYFTDNLPEISVLDLEPNFLKNANFTQIEGEDYRYYTQESTFVFTARVHEANQISIRVNTLDDEGNPLEREVILNWNETAKQFERDNTTSPNIVASILEQTAGTVPTNGNASIVSAAINLYGSGTNTVEVIATNKSGNFATRMLEIVREPATFVMHYPRIDQNPVTKEWIGRVNGNYTRIYLEAENADKIIYNKKDEVSSKTTIRLDGIDRELFVFEVKGLKRGNNKVEFTVVRGTRQDKVTVTLVNADTPVPGAEYKESIAKTNIKAFNGLLQLKFPKGTLLMRNNQTAVDQYLAPDRELLIAIADPTDGRVNKYLHPIANDVPAGSAAPRSPFPTNSQWQSNFWRVANPNPNFRKISPLFWIDGGFIPLSGDGSNPSQSDVLYGSGQYPYEMGKEYYTRNANNHNNQFVTSKQGELTLAYDPNMVQSSWRYVTVFHYGYDDDQGYPQYKWKNIGGIVDPKKNTITVPIQELGYYVVMYMDQSFDDVIGHPWARDFLDTLYSKGIMKNKESRRFETNEAITRGEFATLLVKAFNLPLNYDGPPTFSDLRGQTPQSHLLLYDYRHIETAARAGIVRGSLQQRFLPNNPISRQEAAAMIARAANLKLDTNTTKVQNALSKQFTDALDIDPYAQPSVLAVVNAKLIEGKPNVTSTGGKPTYYFDPKANMRRAEAAAVIMKVLLREKRIPSL